MLVLNNREQAKSRLMQLKKMLLKDKELNLFYTETMTELLRSDKIELVDIDNDCAASDGKIFYISHFATRQTKRRIVYDASAVYQGKSLNSILYAGSDNMQLLSDVLLQFRRFKVAYACDIKQMFLQVGINEGSKNLLRILWFENNELNGPVTTYRFKRQPY